MPPPGTSTPLWPYGAFSQPAGRQGGGGLPGAGSGGGPGEMRREVGTAALLAAEIPL
jgi:hypothetical protein